MKRTLLTATALTALASGAVAQSQWSATAASGGYVYTTTLTSPTNFTQPLYTGTVFTNGKQGGAISINNNVGYVVAPTIGSGTPSMTIVTTRSPNPIAAGATSPTLVSGSVPSTVNWSSTPTTTFSNNVGPITGIQFKVNHTTSDSMVIKVYENPFSPTRDSK